MNIHSRRTTRKLEMKTAALILSEQRDQIQKNPRRLFDTDISETTH